MFYFDKNFGLYVGKLNANEFHKHYGIQISVTANPTINLTIKGEKGYFGNAFYIPSKIEHKLISEEIQLTILINPLSQLGHQLHLNFRHVKTTTLNIDFKELLIHILLKYNTKEIDSKTLCSEIEGVLNDYKCSSEKENHSEDDRIRKALTFMDEHFEQVYSLEEIAELCNLSPSRFLHLFKERTGLNFRRYQLWNRLIKSLPHLTTNSITETAHTFGFTDSSHYIRTFKETFGLNPKFMFHKE